MMRYSTRICTLLLASALLYSSAPTAATRVAHECHVSTQQKAIKLFDRLINAADKKISWKCFSEKMSQLLAKDSYCKDMAPAFSDLTDSTSPMWIYLKLKSHVDRLPASVKRKLAALDAMTLKEIILNKIELNGKINCKKLHDEL